MAMSTTTSKSKFEIEVRTKTRALSLRVRLKGALLGSPAGKTHRVSGSIRARCRTVLLRFSLTLLQVLGTDQPSQQTPAVRYSLLVRVRKLWFRIRGKHQQQECLQGTIQAVKPADIPTPAKKTWRRSLSSAGRQLLRRNKSSVNITTQKSVKDNGYVAQYMDARVLRVVHGVGMVSTLIVLVQLAGTRGLPPLVTFVTGLAIVGRLVFVNRYAFLGPGLQQLWYETMGVGGIFLVPQVLRALLRLYMPQPGITASESVISTFTLILILLARYMRLPFKTMWLLGIVSSVIPSILVLWAPVAHLWTCYWNPAKVNFLEVFTGLLGGLSTCLQGCTQSSLDQHRTLQSLHKSV